MIAIISLLAPSFPDHEAGYLPKLENEPVILPSAFLLILSRRLILEGGRDVIMDSTTPESLFL